MSSSPRNNNISMREEIVKLELDHHHNPSSPPPPKSNNSHSSRGAMMMGHLEYHHHRSSSLPKTKSNDDAAAPPAASGDDNDKDVLDGGDCGGTGGPHLIDSGANEVQPSSNTAPRATTEYTGMRFGVEAAVATADAASALRTTLQPFDISSFKSPGGGMAAAAATLGFPFTPAQWKELERQAMIYKYMTAAIPVPADLLFPVIIPTRNSASHPDPSIPWNGNGAYLRYNSNMNRDVEPGRCKRTDGKKWRCSRDVAPHQKYCERHMHRGRPRSRKHVEIHPSPSSSSSAHNNNSTTDAAAAATATTTTYNNKKSRLQTSVSGYSDHNKPKEALFLDQQNMFPPSNNFKQPNRVFGWSMGGENAVEQQWLHLMDTKRGGMDSTPEHDSIALDTVLQQGYGAEEPLNLFSYSTDNFGTGNLYHDQQRNPPRGFIDAWSNGDVKAMEEESTVPSPDHTLTLSMALDAAGMGLPAAASNSGHNAARCCPVSWLPILHSGGPLAEVLGPSNSVPTSPYAGNGDSMSPPATSVSSPTGILHRALFSQSDSSVGNSPTMGASNTTPDLVAFQWLN